MPTGIDSSVTIINVILKGSPSFGRVIEVGSRSLDDVQCFVSQLPELRAHEL